MSLIRKSQPLPSPAALQLAEELTEPHNTPQNRALARIVKETDVQSQILGDHSRRLDELESTSMWSFLKQVAVPAVVSVVAALLLYLLGIKG